MIQVVGIAVLQDNYIWLMHDDASGETVVIDPAEAAPVLAEAGRRGWRISQVWNTHWHRDHSGGNAEIKAATGCRITGPAAEAAKIPTLDLLVGEGQIVKIGDVEAQILEVPAHTAGHIAYFLPDPGVAFVGDTVFAMGCGRLFEGTPAQMWANMRRIGALPPQTLLYCAHEYTQSNGRYARTAEPDNWAIVARMDAVNAARGRGEPTVPTTVALELATNPFMRAPDVETLARRRGEKDVF